MSTQQKISVSPHIHSGKSTSGIMLDVLIALLPATVAGLLLFGLQAALVVGVCVASCVLFELVFNLLAKKDMTITDLSAAVTGLLLGLNLPVTIPIWQCVIASLFAIVVVKCLFGGIGQNVVNPAITARVFMLVAFSGTMTGIAYTAPITPDAVAGATPLSAEKMPDLLTLFLGNHGGSIGETCAAALLLGFVYLLVRRVITWQVPVVFVGTVFLFSLFMEADVALLQYDFAALINSVLNSDLGDVMGSLWTLIFNLIEPALKMVLSGGLLLGAIFMATDYVTSPPTAWGKVIFGLGCGLMTCLLRYFSGLPEGVSYAILFMNILNPYICNWTKHKVFGEGGAQ